MPEVVINIARYPLIAAGIPAYGATSAEVAASFLTYHHGISNNLDAIYNLHKTAIANVRGAFDIPSVNTFVQNFAAATDWIINP